MLLTEFEKEIKEMLQLQIKIRNVYFKTQNSVINLDNPGVFPQPYFEMRYALEHLAFAFIDENGNWHKDDKLAKEEMKKIRGHLLRCYTDLLEWQFLKLKVCLHKMTKGLSVNYIKEAMPNYYSELKPLFVQTEDMLTEMKSQPESEHNSRMDILDEVQTNCEKLMRETIKRESFDELRQKSKRQSISDIFIKVVFPILTAILGAAAGVLFSCL